MYAHNAISRKGQRPNWPNAIDFTEGQDWANFMRLLAVLALGAALSPVPREVFSKYFFAAFGDADRT